jgi:hypothetical protein
MNNNNNNTDAQDIINRLPVRMREAFKLDEHNHFKLSVEEMELQEVIDSACKEMRVETGEMMPLFKRVWLRREISEYLAKKYGEPVVMKDLVTDKDKKDFVMQKVDWEIRRIRQIAGGNPFKNWSDAERKIRELLNKFGQSLPGEVKSEILITVMASILMGFLSFGKWEKSN